MKKFLDDPIGVRYPRISEGLGWLLIVSGIFHILWMLWTEAAWEGPVSPRKPALFGISSGLTVLSINWVLRQREPIGRAFLVSLLVAICLFTEVAMITLQFWRNVPSHFNRSTPFNTAIESVMLGLILLVTGVIGWISWCSIQLPPMPRARAAAIRWGLGLLLVSCGLGMGITVLGEMNLRSGDPPGIWGRAGVLKYPHGAALHAIQVLPLLAGLLVRLKVPRSALLIHLAGIAHLSFLGHALWQTGHGWSRFDLDQVSSFLLFAAGFLILIPLFAIPCFVLRNARISRDVVGPHHSD